MFSHMPCMALEETWYQGPGEEAVILEAWVSQDSLGDAGISIQLKGYLLWQSYKIPFHRGLWNYLQEPQ